MAVRAYAWRALLQAVGQSAAMLFSAVLMAAGLKAADAAWRIAAFAITR